MQNLNAGLIVSNGFRTHFESLLGKPMCVFIWIGWIRMNWLFSIAYIKQINENCLGKICN